MSETIVNIPFSGGIDEKPAAQYLDPQARQTDVRNGEFVYQGTVETRLGLEYVPRTVVGGTLPEMTEGVRVANWSRSALTALGSGALYTFSESRNGMVGVSKLPDCRVVRRPLVTAPSPSAPQVTDMPLSDGRTLRIATYWDDRKNILATVFDRDTGDVLVQPRVIYTSRSSTFNPPMVSHQFFLPNADPGKQMKIFIFDLWDLGEYVINFDPVTLAFTGADLLFSVLYGFFTVSTIEIVPFEGDPDGGYVAVHGLNDKLTLRLEHYDSSNDSVLLTKDITVFVGDNHHAPSALTANYSASNAESVWLTFSTYDFTTFRQYLNLVRMTGDGAFTTENTSFHFAGGVAGVDLRPSGSARTAAHAMIVHAWSYTDPYSASTIYIQGAQGQTWSWSGGPGAGGNVLTGQTPSPIGWMPMSKPFVANGGRVYQCFSYDPKLTLNVDAASPRSLQVSLYLMEHTKLTGDYVNVYGGKGQNTMFPVGSSAVRLLDPQTYFLQSAVQGYRKPFVSSLDPSSGQYGFGIKVRALSASAVGGVSGGSFVTDFAFTDEAKRELYQTAEIATELAIAAGVPMISDGAKVFEESYFHYPEAAVAQLNVATAGVTLGLGQYLYAVVYSWRDAAGLEHRSNPVFTPPFVLSTPGYGCQVWIPPYSVTYRNVGPAGSGGTLPATDVYANVFRTQRNGAIFYFIDRIVVSNNPNAAVILWPDAVNSDNNQDVIAGYASLVYTTGGGQLDEVNPPGSTHLVVHGNRKAMADETLQSVWFTKEFEEGIAPGWNEGATKMDFPEGGDITAIKSMDGTLIVFKADSIWALPGNGPLDNGQGSDWTVPEQITTDVGAKSWTSVVLFPAGIIFQSSKGSFHVLRRNRQVEFIGEVVQVTMRDFPIVTSATLVPNKQQVRFTCLNEAEDASVVLVYDYHHGYWSHWDYSQVGASPIISATMTGTPKRYTVVTKDGHVFREKLEDHATAYKDDDSSGTAHFVPLSVKSAGIRMSVQAYLRCNRVQFFGERLASCGFTMEIFTDNEPQVKQLERWYPDQVDANGPQNGQLLTHVGAEFTRSMSVQCRFTTTEGAAGTNGQSMRFVSAAFAIENLGGRKPVGVSSQR